MYFVVSLLLVTWLVARGEAGTLSNAVKVRFEYDDADAVRKRIEVLDVVKKLLPSLDAKTSSDPARLALQPFIDWANKFANDPNGATVQHTAALDDLIDQLPSSASLAAVRRVVVTGIALRLLQSGPVDPITELTAEAALLTLYIKHRSTALRKGAAEFTHISKAGGTSLCHLSRLNGCNPPIHNCVNNLWQDQARWTNTPNVYAGLPPDTNLTCKIVWPYRPRQQEHNCTERREAMRQKGQVFYANEYTTVGGRQDPSKAHMCHDEMVTVLLVRDPHKRALSHMRHWWRFLNIECRAQRNLFFRRGFDDLATWKRLMTASLDNYIVRSMLGEALYEAPFGAVTRDHLALATNMVLNQYDILLVRDVAEQYNTTVALGLGWCMYDVHDMDRVYRDDEMLFDAEAIWNGVRDSNSIDQELYTYIYALSQLDLVVYDIARHAGYGERQSTNKCTCGVMAHG